MLLIHGYVSNFLFPNGLAVRWQVTDQVIRKLAMIHLDHNNS
ncbi:hypothetical protein GO013_12545 [Pseudodesulfovibrio sp. JC047]|nr:hypothetical protein [Pseudodesulfovibrio sp. JC047]